MIRIKDFNKELDALFEKMNQVDGIDSRINKHRLVEKLIEKVNEVHEFKDEILYVNPDYYYIQKDRKSLYAQSQLNEIQKTIYFLYPERSNYISSSAIGFSKIEYTEQDEKDTYREKVTLFLKNNQYDSLTKAYYSINEKNYALFIEVKPKNESITLSFNNPRKKPVLFNSFEEFEKSEIVDLLSLENDIVIPRSEFKIILEDLKDIMYKPKRIKKSKLYT